MTTIAEVAAQSMVQAIAAGVPEAPKFLMSMNKTYSFANNVAMTAEDIVKGVLAGNIVNEAITGEMVPTYDYDRWVSPDEGKLEDLEKAAIAEVRTTLQTMWGEHAQIYMFTSSGIKTCVKNGVTKTGPYISLRTIVRCCCKFACGADMKRGGYVPQLLANGENVMDQGVYREEGKLQLMRVWGASKAGEDRPVRYVLPDGKSVTLAEHLATRGMQITAHMFAQALAQNVGDLPLLEVFEPEPMSVGEGGQVIGKNGMPLGDDAKVSAQDVRALCEIAGWFTEKNRDYNLWCQEMWLLRNIADDMDIDLLDVMMEVSAVCKEKHTPESVHDITRVSKNRPHDMPRKNLGSLRAQAKSKNEGEYLRWLSNVKRAAPVEAKVPSEGKIDVDAEYSQWVADTTREPYLFDDHNGLVGKNINLETAQQWLDDAVVMIMNGGEPYFLTRNKLTCKQTNRQYEAWLHAKQDKLLQCLDVNVFIKNPLYDEKVGLELATMRAAGGTPTPVQIKLGEEFLFTTFGPHHGKIQGFIATQIYKRKLHWCGHVDFIPYLHRRVPDARIEKAVKNPAMFNKFRGFPIETLPLKPSAPQFLGSAWQRHLRDDICHGDETEWKHLEATIADMIQRPYRVSNVAHVFQANQGTGKSFLFKFMSDLLGAAHTMLITDMNVYMQKFNEDQSTALLKVFEEVRGKGDQFINNDRLKADITKEVLRVEIKGGAILTMRHCSRYWMLTNHRDTLHIEADDRRYVYHSVSNAHANDRDYFEPIVAELHNEDYIRACFEYFAELPYEERLAMTAITTSYKNEQKLDSMPLPLKFLRDFVEENGVVRIDPLKVDGDKMSSAALHGQYVIWCQSNNVKWITSENFLKSIARVGIAAPKNVRMHGGQVKCVIVNREAVRAGIRDAYKMPNFDWSE